MNNNKVDFRNAFFDEFYKIASKDKDIIFLAADTDAESLVKFRKNFPKQFFNTGVTEQNAISVAAGLAKSGKKVFVYSMVPFITLRCFEQIKIDICSMNLQVCLIGLGTGLSFSYYGSAGHGVIDIAVMRTLPEMRILNPCDPISASKAAKIAYNKKGPSYVRLHKEPRSIIYDRKYKFNGTYQFLKSGKRFCIVSTGLMTEVALKTYLFLKEKNIEVSVLDIFQIKPLNQNLIAKEISKYKKIVTIEDNSIIGGIGSMFSEIITDFNLKTKLKKFAIKDEQTFIYGDNEWLLKQYKLDCESLNTSIKKYFSS
jgi:transketolase